MPTNSKRNCPSCGEPEFALQVVTDYKTDLFHEGRRYPITVPLLEILRCDVCGLEAIGEDADHAMNRELRREVGLLQPEEILAARTSLGLEQADMARALSITVSTMADWETGHQIQPKAMDQLLRVFIAVPEARAYLGAPVASLLTSVAEPASATTPISPMGAYSD